MPPSGIAEVAVPALSDLFYKGQPDGPEKVSSGQHCLGCSGDSRDSLASRESSGVIWLSGGEVLATAGHGALILLPLNGVLGTQNAPSFLLEEGDFLIISPFAHMEMSLDFLSAHQLAGRRQPRRLLAGEERRKEREGREPGQDEKFPVFSQAEQ